MFRACLGHQHLIDDQVRQTLHGADIMVVPSGDIDTNALTRQIERSLTDLGLFQPNVTVTRAESLDRQTETVHPGELRTTRQGD